jgi:hypothetical protein
VLAQALSLRAGVGRKAAALALATHTYAAREVHKCCGLCVAMFSLGEHTALTMQTMRTATMPEALANGTRHVRLTLACLTRDSSHCSAEDAEYARALPNYSAV